MSSQTEKRLEEIFGKVPKNVEENVRHFVYNENKKSFVCVSCQLVMKLCDEKGLPTGDLESHLVSRTHTDNNYSIEALQDALKETFLGKIPQIVYNNIIVMDMDDINYHCTVCDKILHANHSPAVLEKNFTYHFLSFKHVENLDTFRKMMRNLVAVYGGIPDIIVSNSKFLSCKGKDFFCDICEELIKVVHTNLSETENNFRSHLNSKKHLIEAKQAVTFSRIPKLKEIFSSLPGYVLRNVEYLSMNGPNFFCSLCNENIKYIDDDPYLTEQNFKLHYFSSVHEESLIIRSDPNNDVFCALQNIFSTFPESALENFKYLTLNENTLSCTICDAIMVEEEGTNESIIEHLQSDFHKDNVVEELQRRNEIVEELKLLCGSVPMLIQDTVEYLEYKGGENFACVVCSEDINLKSVNNVPEVAIGVVEDSFITHIDSEKHSNEMKALLEVSESLEADMQRLYEFVPTFMTNSWNHLGYSYNEWEDFYCSLCDSEIHNDYENKRDEIILKNFRTHLLSSGHGAQLKLKAKLEMEVTDKLESIFGKIPSFILSNIEHIHRNQSGFYCNICHVQVTEGIYPELLEQNFLQHLSSSCHKSKANNVLKMNERALSRLDERFSRIPEFLLRNIDLLFVFGNDLYCIICQETLQIDCNFLDRTKQSLRCHFYSKKHLDNMKNV